MQYIEELNLDLLPPNTILLINEYLTLQDTFRLTLVSSILYKLLILDAKASKKFNTIINFLPLLFERPYLSIPHLKEAIQDIYELLSLKKIQQKFLKLEKVLEEGKISYLIKEIKSYKQLRILIKGRWDKTLLGNVHQQNSALYELWDHVISETNFAYLKHNPFFKKFNKTTQTETVFEALKWVTNHCTKDNNKTFSIKETLEYFEKNLPLFRKRLKYEEIDYKFNDKNVQRKIFSVLAGLIIGFFISYLIAKCFQEFLNPSTGKEEASNILGGFFITLTAFFGAFLGLHRANLLSKQESKVLEMENDTLLLSGLQIVKFLRELLYSPTKDLKSERLKNLLGLLANDTLQDNPYLQDCYWKLRNESPQSLEQLIDILKKNLLYKKTPMNFFYKPDFFYQRLVYSLKEIDPASFTIFHQIDDFQKALCEYIENCEEETKTQLSEFVFS